MLMIMVYYVWWNSVDCKASYWHDQHLHRCSYRRLITVLRVASAPCIYSKTHLSVVAYVAAWFPWQRAGGRQYWFVSLPAGRLWYLWLSSAVATLTGDYICTLLAYWQCVVWPFLLWQHIIASRFMCYLLSILVKINYTDFVINLLGYY